MEYVTVDTIKGRIKGIDRGEDLLFRGIPYAVTERFQMPKEYPPFEQFDATKEETDCFQFSSFHDEKSSPVESFYHDEFRSDRTFHYAESPMSLNIIAPKDAKKVPVIIFIHGGGFETGTVGELPYGDSDEYAKRGVILVSMGYRLNAFSMYEGNNFGFHDLLSGINWVYENIEAFGGDRERIILMGQSAGAMTIMDLLYTKKLEGIVKGAVTMSGGGLVPKMARPYTREEMKDYWKRVREKAGVSEEEAYTVDAEKLWRAWYEVSRDPYDLHLAQPPIDGEIIPKLPQEVLKEGSYLDIPMIMGVTSQDFMPYIVYEMSYRFALHKAKNGGSPVYGYMFDRTPPGERFKAFHAVDLWYLFGNMERSWRPFEKTDYELKDLMIDHVVQFAKTLSPNGEGLPYWPPITTKERNFRLFDGKENGLISPMKCRFKEYKSFLFDKGPM